MKVSGNRNMFHAGSWDLKFYFIFSNRFNRKDLVGFGFNEKEWLYDA